MFPADSTSRWRFSTPSGGAFLPFITLYFQDRGLSFAELSAVHAVAALVGSTIPFLWGWIADRWVAAEKLLVLLHLGGGLALFVLPRQESMAGLLCNYAVVLGCYAPTTSLLSALIYHHLRSPETQFGKVRLFGSVGWMLPSLPIFLWLAFQGGTQGSTPRDLRFTLDLAALLEVVTAVICFRLPRTPPAAGASPLAYRQALRQLFARRSFLPFLGVIFFAHAAFGVLFYYSPPALEAAGFDRRWIGPLQCLGVVVEPVLFCFLPRLIGRHGYQRTIALGCLLLLARHLVYALPSPLWLLAASYVLAGGVVVFYATAVSLSLNAMAERSVRATAQTLLALVGPGLGQVFGHRVFGWLATRDDAHGLTAGFWFAAGCAGLALSLVLVLVRGKHLFVEEAGTALPEDVEDGPRG